MKSDEIAVDMSLFPNLEEGDLKFFTNTKINIPFEIAKTMSFLKEESNKKLINGATKMEGSSIIEGVIYNLLIELLRSVLSMYDFSDSGEFL